MVDNGDMVLTGESNCRQVPANFMACITRELGNRPQVNPKLARQLGNAMDEAVKKLGIEALALCIAAKLLRNNRVLEKTFPGPLTVWGPPYCAGPRR